MPRDFRDYHEASKHHLDRYARSAGTLDWANQPVPFRFYEGAPVLPLPFLQADPAAGHAGLYEPKQPPAEIDLAHVAGFLELSMALSAWKAAGGSRWPLRINPSSGNLHPTETHLVIPPVPGCEAGGIFHYDPLNHRLEKRASPGGTHWKALRRYFGSEGFLVGLASIYWRESWKYGERAFRYCHHDVGHALAALRIAANLFGWRLQVLNELGDADIARVLGLESAAFPALEAEEADLLCRVGPPADAEVSGGLPDGLADALAALGTAGRPNRLSREPVEWEIIYRTAADTRKPRTRAAQEAAPHDFEGDFAGEPSRRSAAALIRRRRSATAFDPNGTITRASFFALLDRTLPRRDTAPFDVDLGAGPAAHLLVFVHRVTGLDPGLYFFCRNLAHLAELRRMARPEFAWEPVAPPLPLYRLAEGDFRRTAMQVSCHQEIAGESAFSLGMLARFDERIDAEPFRYRRLFWETGMIGQVLYLEAEAQAARGTGIGCFFDDEVHALFGLESGRYQSLYHFTVGIPIEDRRLRTTPPYAHLKDRASPA